MPGRQCRTAWSGRNKIRRREKEMSRGLISFFGCATAHLVQGNPQSLIVPFRLHQVSEAFRRCATADLVQGNTQSLIVPFRLHQVSGAFRRCATADLVQGNPQSLIVLFRLHQVSGAFRRCAAADLVQGNLQSPIVPFRLHQVSGAFRRCAPLLWAFPQIIKQKQINIQLFLQLMKSTVLYSLRVLQALVCCSIYTV